MRHLHTQLGDKIIYLEREMNLVPALLDNGYMRQSLMLKKILNLFEGNKWV